MMLEADGGCECRDKYLMRGGHYQPAAHGGGQLPSKGKEWGVFMSFHRAAHLGFSP